MSYIRPESLSDLKECKRLGRERRERIRDLIFELLAGDAIATHELQHFKLVSSLFHLPDRIEALTDAGHPEARLELMVAVMLTAAEMALDDQPRESDHAFARRMEAQLQANAADIRNRKTAAAAVANDPEPEPVEPEPSAQDALDRIRQKNRDRQRERRAKLKAKKAR